MNNHGKVFTISDACELESRHLIPKRANVLNPTDIARTKANIDNGSDLLFLANDVEQSISKNKYELMLHGITPCGSKTTVIIKGILPYIDISVNSVENAEQERMAIQSKLHSFDIEFVRVDIISGQDFMHYYHEEKKYLRVYFKTLKNRLSCINLCIEDNIKTFSNDRSTYYRVVARNYEINLSGWNLLKNYREIFGSKFKSQFVISIDINDLKAFSDENHSTELCSVQDFKYEKMILAGFDIEMIPHDLNKFPDADKCLKDSIFMICTTFHFAKKPESMLSVCLTLKENDPLDDVVSIVCESEAVLLLAFSKLFEMMQPDFITEFNGGGFDWRNIITKSLSFGIIGPFLQNMSLTQMEFWETKPTMISRYFSEKMIKIDGATASSFCKTLKMPGYVNFDTLVVFKQLEPNADSHKLNECLKRCNLGSKDDMDIKEMFRIYREGTSEEMKMVAHYCFIDTFKLQSLLLKKNVIQDRREISVLSFTSIFDSFYYANGSKVRNLLMNAGAKRNYMFDTLYKPTIEDPDAKFPGAFVVPPIKGIVKPCLRYDEFLAYRAIPFDDNIIADGYTFVEKHFDAINDRTLDLTMDMPEPVRKYMSYMQDTENQYPVSGLDYSSLYPSIIMTYNISPETLVVDREYAEYLKSIGVNMFYVTFRFLNRDFHAWFKQHNNDPNEYGLCPAILIDLFAKRAAMKKIMKPYGDKIFEMEMEMKTKEYSDTNEYPRMEEYNETCFDFNYYNAKQKALKVFMNTYYGEMGNFISFICAVETAASVTTLGRFNLKLAKAYVEDKLNMKIYYGDTDSLYIACNKNHFTEIDREYFTGKIDKLDYGTQLVEKTFELIEIAKNEVNAHLVENNGSNFLKMAYEEVLYPAIFLSKKKYMGVPHEEKINFYPKKPFLKGLEVVKRGTSDVLKDICMKIIMEVLDIKCVFSMLELVSIAIKRFFNTEWNVNHFIKTAVYRLDKQNASVRRLIGRYESIQYKIIPEPNVRFKYIVCKRYPWTYNERGNQTELTIGDRMELVERVVEENIPIDLEYYFDNEITGQMARLIAYEDRFDTIDRTTLNPNLTEKEFYTKIEEALFKNAKKYIAEIAKTYCNPYTNKGGLYKKTYKAVSSIIRAKDQKTRKVNSIHPSNVRRVVDILDGCDRDITIQFLKKRLERYINKHYEVDVVITIEDIIPLHEYITQNNLNKYLTDCTDAWISNIVQFIRTEHDYDTICEMSLDINDIYDILTVDDLKEIVKKEDLYVGLTIDQANHIINMVSMIVSTYV